MFGYSKERFPNLEGEMFDCIICSQVVRRPKQCLGCGNMYCTECIDQWAAKNAGCPNRCKQKIVPLSSVTLLNLYNELDILCEKECKMVVKLEVLEQHQANCVGKCWNNQICGRPAVPNLGKQICSVKCEILRSLLYDTGRDLKKMYNLLLKYKSIDKQPGIIPVNDGVKVALKWALKSAGSNISFDKGDKLVHLKENTYVFRTVLADVGFVSGEHYWEIIADQRTENELKIGVSISNSFDFNTAFSDHPFGYAYYGLGQLRSGSNASGTQYGKRFKKEGVLGVYLNMNKGILSFSWNGSSFGVAFQNESLKKGPIYPAVALLHCAACTLNGELPIPPIFK